MVTALLLLSIFPLSLIGLISYNTSRQIIINNVHTHLQTVGILKQQAIDKWIEHLQHSVYWLTQEPIIAADTKTLTISQPNSPEYEAASRSLVSSFERYVEVHKITHVSLIDRVTGQIIVSSAPEWVGKIRNVSSFFLEGKKDVFVSDIFLSLSMRRPTMVISAPVTRDGELLGVIAVHADFDELSGIMLERTGLGETTETFLVNNSNLLITNTVFAPNGAFKKWIFGEGAVRAIAGESDVDLFIDYRDKEVLGAYFWLPDRKLALIAKQDVSEAFAPIDDLRRKILIIGLAIVGLVLLVSFLFGQKILTPIHKLVTATREAGNGNLNYRIRSSAEDEIGTLSKAFDHMAENLQNITISLDEKEVLLREIHHRVKNNLQMVQSLLNLQISQLSIDEVIAPLRDSMHRITSIAMVHETLYKSEDLSTIDLESYFLDLTNYLMKSLQSNQEHIEVACNIEQLPISLDGVISCGLIINELITNALKHAFPEGRGMISITLQMLTSEENQVELVVADNGVGIESFDELENRNSLGIDLVNILVENQLEGTIEMKNDSGLTYRIIFPL